MRIAFLLLLLTVAVAAETEYAPRPYSARQIREAMPVGFKCHYWTKKEGVHSHEHWEVIHATETEVEILYSTTDGDGRPVGEPNTRTHRWAELRNHALFPADWTTIEDIVQKTPAGEFDCWLYVVSTPDGTVRRFYFAKDKAGAPVEFGSWKGDQELERTVLMDFTIPGREFP